MKAEAFGKALLRRKSTNARSMKSDVNELMGPLVVEAHHQLRFKVGCVSKPIDPGG